MWRWTMARTSVQGSGNSKLKANRNRSQSSHRTPCYFGSDSNKSANRGVMLRGFNQRCSKSNGTSNREHARPPALPHQRHPRHVNGELRPSETRQVLGKDFRCTSTVISLRNTFFRTVAPASRKMWATVCGALLHPSAART